MTNREYKDEDWLREKYIDDELSMSEIGGITGRCASTILYWLRKFDIDTRTSEGRVIDETGNRYGSLTVLERAGTNEHGDATWLCECDCGEETIVRGDKLRDGRTKSCGCYGKEPWEPAFNALFSYHKHGAKRRSLKFDLSKGEFLTLTGGNCVYCGAEPSQIAKRRDSTYIYNGVDRINNDRGYTIENVASCCGVCNIMKSDMGIDEFFAHIERIHENESHSASDIDSHNINDDNIPSLKNILASYKRKAEKRSIVFDLSMDEFAKLTKGDCAYCGAPPSQVNKRDNSTYVYNGVDRINGNLWYTINNVVSCCGTCNWMKMDMNVDEFFAHVTRIYEYSNYKKEEL